MSCDFYVFAETTDRRLIDDLALFSKRGSRIRNFLACGDFLEGVDPISKPRGFPNDVNPWVVQRRCDHGWLAFDLSWLSMDELDAFDYDAEIVSSDRRGYDPDKLENPVPTYREYLGEYYFDELSRMRAHGVDRITFWMVW